MHKAGFAPSLGDCDGQSRQLLKRELGLHVWRQPEQHLFSLEFERLGVVISGGLLLILDIDEMGPSLTSTGLQDNIYALAIALLEHIAGRDRCREPCFR
ncbi:hypothetical protein BGX87_28180 [Burkholderia ubonensis]|nr:hypothetical protein BGX87_28180 [Burkholderia ubonensis]